MLLALSVLTVACYSVIFVAPNNPFNPFPPPAGAALLPTNTPGPTDTPTGTPTATRTPRLTNTPTRTPMPSPTLTETPVVTRTVAGTRTPSPIPTLGPPATPTPTRAPFSYVARVEYQRSIYGLNWVGIAGYVLGLDRKHQTNIVVRVWGDPPLGATGQEVASGIAPQYGVSGFEFTLGDKPATGVWNVQLMGDDGQPLSDVVPIQMDSDPRYNLAFIWFEQNH
jgi:hypothetical protein